MSFSLVNYAQCCVRMFGVTRGWSCRLTLSEPRSFCKYVYFLSPAHVMLKTTFLVLSRISRNSTESLLVSIGHQQQINDSISNMVDSVPSDIVTMSEDLSIGERSRGGRAGGRGRHNRGNPRGSGGKAGNREVAVSKALSKLLRHAAEDEGLALDAEGFARLDQVVSLRMFFFPPSCPV
jgi:hypothetical protein